MNHKRFLVAFQISKLVIFEVEYGAIVSNKDWYFATRVEKFVKNKRDYATCGQCQERVLPNGWAKEFYSKWDNKHLKPLTSEQYEDLIKDILWLKTKYNHIEKAEDFTLNHIPFSQIKELSMQPLKKKIK